MNAETTGMTLALWSAYTPAQLDQAKAANYAREYTCRHIAVTTEPEMAEARKRCEQGAELSDVLAVAAGADACLDAWAPKDGAP